MEDKTKLLQVKENWYDIFECPVCREYFSAPVLLCVNGHSICSVCKDRAEKCPVCRSEFSLSRNYLCEQLLENTSFPCLNADYGCEETVFLRGNNDHEKVCPYRLYECLPGKVDGTECMWMGRRTEILDHVETEHSLSAWMIGEEFQIIYEDFYMEEDFNDNQIISAYGEIFWYQLFFNDSKKSLYISVHYIGPHENCSKYFYKIHFIASDSSNYEVLLCNQTHADSINIEDLTKYDDVTCFRLKCDIANHFIDDNRRLKFSLTITEVSQ